MLFGHARLPRLNDVKLLRPAGVQRLFEGDPVSAEDPVDRSLGRHNLELLWFEATSFKKPISMGFPAG